MKKRILLLVVLALSACSLSALEPSPILQLSAMSGVTVGTGQKSAKLEKRQPNYAYTAYFAAGKVYMSQSDYQQWVANMDTRWTTACRSPEGIYPPEYMQDNGWWWEALATKTAQWWTPTATGVVAHWLTDNGNITAKFEQREQALYLMINGDVHPDYCRLEWLEPRPTRMP